MKRYEVSWGWESQENNETDWLKWRCQTANLKLRVKDLRTVLTIVGKCVAQGHYDAVASAWCVVEDFRLPFECFRRIAICDTKDIDA